MTFSEFIARWKDSGAAERANKDSFLNDLCDSLQVERPNPTTGDIDRDTAADTLRTIFTQPLILDPSKQAAKVTREIAAHLANLARSLERQQHEPERVAKFLMRCVFTMFAEDVDLLPKETFAKALE